MKSESSLTLTQYFTSRLRIAMKVGRSVTSCACHAEVYYIADLYSCIGSKYMFTRQKQQLSFGCEEKSGITYVIHQGVALMLVRRTAASIDRWFHIVDVSSCTRGSAKTNPE